MSKEKVRVPKKTGDSEDFISEPISDEESHVAVCTGVFYLGLQEGDWKGKTFQREEIVLLWEVDEKYSEGDLKGKRKKISKRYTFSYAKKANLYKDLCNWFGTKYVDSVRDTLNIYALLGKGCLMSVYHVEKDDRTYARVDAIQKLPKTMKTFKPSELIEDDSDAVPEWIQEIKKKAIEEDDEPKTTKKAKKQVEDEADDDEDDDPLGGGGSVKESTKLEDDELE